MGDLIQLGARRWAAAVYHAAARDDVPKIMVEGLLPLGKNRTKEIQVVDYAFDLVAARLGLVYRRTGIFGWPEREKTIVGGDSVVLEVRVDPTKCLVLHQAWMDLAWGIMDDIAERIRTNKRPECINLPTAELFDLLRPAQLYEGRFDEVLFELATKYWRTATTLATYDPKALTDAVLVATERFPALMPGLGHEVLLADKIVEPSRVQPVT